MAENLKIYLLDILSILVPGALFMAVLGQFPIVECNFLEVFPERDIEWINAVVYIGTAYVLGHFIFFIGSFLDDWIFENVKRVFYTNHQLSAQIVNYKILKSGIEEWRVINAFKWSCAWLLSKKPDMYSVVERYIAESKFFRSLIVVLFLSEFAFIYKEKYFLVGLLGFLIVLSLVRYLTQRQKSIETAYHFIIATSSKEFPSHPDPAIILRLDAENIYPCKNIKFSKESVAIKVWFWETYCIIVKVLAVLNLCLNPFHKKSKGDSIRPDLYESKEIRWFFQETNETIERWFASRNQTFKKVEPRIDFYLPLPQKEDISVKLREGNIEIKQRKGQPYSSQLTDQASGFVEDWLKWSFEIDNNDKLANSLINEKKYDWIEVRKERLGIKFQANCDGSITMFDINEMIPQGCQIEYTKLLINGKVWYTFGLEWFGGDQQNIPSSIRAELLNNKLSVNESMGYNKFLNGLSN